MAHYTPPVQSKLSQIIDVIVLVALTLGALFVPLWLGLAGSTKTVAAPVADPTWETLGQTPIQAAQYEALGYTPATAHDIILARFDYSFSTVEVLVMVVVIVAYYFLMLRFSDSEYREVIDEKFGQK